MTQIVGAESSLSSCNCLTHFKPLSTPGASPLKWPRTLKSNYYECFFWPSPFQASDSDKHALLDRAPFERSSSVVGSCSQSNGVSKPSMHVSQLGQIKPLPRTQPQRRIIASITSSFVPLRHSSCDCAPFFLNSYRRCISLFSRLLLFTQPPKLLPHISLGPLSHF